MKEEGRFTFYTSAPPTISRRTTPAQKTKSNTKKTMKTDRMQKRAAALFGAALLVLTATVAQAYDANYKRSQCDAYTLHGLNERYVFGGDLGWIDNDVWDSS